MPVNKRRKRNANAVEKRDIKRRLIEMSIRVDGYIYKNKPITIEEAEKYKHEISIYQPRCNNDKHMLQVIEKLMRCMKKIIEETPKIIPSLENVSTPENFQFVDLPRESSIFNKYEDNNVMIDHCNLTTLKAALSKNKNQNSNIIDNIIISDSENEPPTKYKNEAKLPIDNRHINDVSIEGSVNLNEKNNELKSCNINTLNKANVIEVHSMDVNTTQTALINDTNDKNTEYSKADKVYYENIAHKTNEIMNDNSVLTIVSSKIKRKYTKKINKNVANVQQTSMPPIRNDNTRNNKKKKISGAIQKPLPCDQPSNSEAITITIPPKIVSQKNKTLVPKNNAKHDLPKATHRRKKSTNKNNNTKISNIQSSSITAPLLCSPNTYKHTPVDISNEVALPVCRARNNEVRNIVTYQDSVTKQMGALTIYNKHVLNDLSWVESIRYVREIGTDEFDQSSNTYDETFWTNFVLPKDWKDVDFLD